MKARHLIPFVLLACLYGIMNAGSTNDTWTALQSLVGTWEGFGTGSPGAGGGVFSFAVDLQGRIIVRKNHSEYPASEGRPATVHDDLLIAYQDDSSRAVRAIFFDNEGHVIHYAVNVSSDKKTVTFVSAPEPAAPRFRLSYLMNKGDELTITFEIAPPGKPDSFKTYLEGKARRKG